MIYPWRNAFLCIVAEVQNQLFSQIARKYTGSWAWALFVAPRFFWGEERLSSGMRVMPLRIALAACARNWLGWNGERGEGWRGVISR